jgi:denticleless
LAQIERSRTILHPHSNGIFDIKWNRSDNLIATASGDQSVRITCLTTSKVVNVLRGHTHTVKSVAWDPNHHDLLSTGGRDGIVCVWDLRIGERKKIEDMNVMEAIPVLTIPCATGPDYKSAANKRKAKPRPNGSVTSLVYPCREPYRLISSGSVDGWVFTNKNSR